MKSELFKVHMKKTKLDDGFQIQCNYCTKSYKVVRNFGYGMFWTHIKKNHLSEYAMVSNQAQISRYVTSSDQLFHYTSEKKK